MSYRRWLIVAALVTSPRPAAADQLAELIGAARRDNLELREQAARVDEADGLTRVERSARYPSLTLRGGYQHNSDEIVVDLAGGAERLVALDELDGDVTVEVPMFDLEARSRVVAADAEADGRRAIAAAAAVEVERAVVLAYYRWIAGNALVEAARIAEATAQGTVAAVEQRRAGGFASEVDVARARADVARARQRLADAHLVVAGARRQLRTLTGRDVAGDAPPLPDDTRGEAPLDDWLGGAGRVPDVRAAAAAHGAADFAASQAERAWLPVVDAFARGRLDNEPGFAETATWSVGVTVSWRLDLRTLRGARVADARERIGAARLARASRDARDRIVDAWDLVDARRAAVAATSAELAAARDALSVAQTRIAAGLATPIDLLDAQRDAFAAEVGAVQARADLAAARALLRLAAGREVAP